MRNFVIPYQLQVEANAQRHCHRSNSNSKIKSYRTTGIWGKKRDEREGERGGNVHRMTALSKGTEGKFPRELRNAETQSRSPT